MSCTCGKAPFISRGEAVATARKVERDHGGRQRPYRCPGDPTLWHLATEAKKRSGRR